MRSSHKDTERTEPPDHEQWIANLRWTFVVHAFKILGSIYIFGTLTSGFAVYKLFSAKVEINNARISALEKQITEIKNEQKSSFEWIAVTENHFQKILAEAKLANDKKQQENIKKLIEKLDRIK